MPANSYRFLQRTCRLPIFCLCLESYHSSGTADVGGSSVTCVVWFSGLKYFFYSRGVMVLLQFEKSSCFSSIVCLNSENLLGFNSHIEQVKILAVFTSNMDLMHTNGLALGFTQCLWTKVLFWLAVGYVGEMPLHLFLFCTTQDIHILDIKTPIKNVPIELQYS